MNIYLAHPHGADYMRPLFDGLRNSTIGRDHTLVIPHEHSDELFDSKTFFKTCDLVIAEVSVPKLGVGIELGWANLMGVPIVCIHTADVKPAQSLRAITEIVLPYTDTSDAVAQLETYVEQHTTTH